MHAAHVEDDAFYSAMRLAFEASSRTAPPAPSASQTLGRAMAPMILGAGRS